MSESMKYVRQFAIILLFSFWGEILHVIIPLSIPASVYGLVLLLAALCIKIVKVEQVQEGAGFLIEIMPVMFIPAAVGLLTSWELLKPICIPVIVITVVTTVIVMVSTGMVTQGIIRKERKKEEQDQ